METNAEVSGKWVAIEKKIDSGNDGSSATIKVENLIHSIDNIVRVDDAIVRKVAMICCSVKSWALFPIASAVNFRQATSII
jgi:hypothetical protein